MRAGACSQTSRCGTGWATGTTPSRFHTSTCADAMAKGSGARRRREAGIQKRGSSDLHTFSRSHHVSRRSFHSRATRPSDEPKTPGQSGLTASFATRGPRVQIPSAPQFRLVLVDKMPRAGFGLEEGFSPPRATRRATKVPQDRRPRHLSGREVLSHSLLLDRE